MSRPKRVTVALARGAEASALKRAVGRGLDRHNVKAAGPYRDSSFTIGARGADGAIAGGFVTQVYYETAFLKWAWVSPEHQRGGIGRKLMQATEREAKKRGATILYLDTFSFQARPFYEKLGFRVFGTLRMGRKGVTRYWMAKRLRTP